jgi:integrase
MPLLCARSSGLPLVQPTLYALTELRGTNKASATIEQALRGVMVLHLVLDQLGVDLDERLGRGQVLNLGELEELARQSRTPLSEMAVGVEGAVRKGKAAPLLTRERLQRVGRNTDVESDTSAIRMHYIRSYIRWRGTAQLLRLGPEHEHYEALERSLELALRVLKERQPRARDRNTDLAREGLSAEARDLLLDVIRPEALNNPWTGTHARARNHVMVSWLHNLGLRRGELLGVRVGDINFQTNEVLIPRRADDPVDPRRRQPNAKTSDRLLALDEGLAGLTRAYITHHRRAIRGARKHDFLFVANGSGAPLTLAGLNKVFMALRDRVDGLPEALSPHVLRHTWNDAFSALMDAERVPEDLERKMLSTLMGWSPTSETAVVYTRRHTRNKAQKASLALQQALKKGVAK